MAYEVVILDEAQREYRAIVAYLCDILGSPQAASSFMDEFDYQVSLIADNPELFVLSRMPELAARGYRAAHVKNYIFLYAIRGDRVVIAHMFHQTQDYGRLV